MNEYIKFEEVFFEKIKTKRFEVISTRNNDFLGRIYWYPSWRQYIFAPIYNTVWSKECLKTIEDFLQNLMNERK